MKVDVVVCGAIIVDEDMIIKAINSIPNYEWNEKWILFDGCPENRDEEDRQKYINYKQKIRNMFPDFKVIEFDENIYYRKMIHHITKESIADDLFIIQDDVVVENMNLKEIIKDKNELDFEIVCFRTKQLTPEGSFWYEPFDDTYPKNYILTHGWTERVYLTGRKWILNILNNLQPLKNKRCEMFIDTHYYRMMNLEMWKNMDYDSKLDYWKLWKVSVHYSIFHKHLNASRGGKKYKK
jgi:hypothetical protein